MSEYEIPFINACIRAFGKRFSLSREESYDYLQRYAGLTLAHMDISGHFFFSLEGVWFSLYI